MKERIRSRVGGVVFAKVLCLSSIISFGQVSKFSKKLDTPEEKKNFAVELTRRYSPEIYPLVNAHEGEFLEYYLDNSNCDGFHITNQIGVLAHESAHTFVKYLGPDHKPLPTVFEMQVNRKTKFTMPIKHYASAYKIVEIIPKEAKEKMGRLTYITDKTLATNTVGIYGMLDEFYAYYRGANTQYDMRMLYWEKFNSPDKWVNFMISAEEHLTAYYEFKLFFSWYLQYYKEHNYEVYESIINDQNIKEVFTMIDSKYSKLIDDYCSFKDEICREQHIIKDPDKKDHYKYRVGTEYRSEPLYDVNIRNLKKWLSEPSHKILKKLQTNKLMLAKNMKGW